MATTSGQHLALFDACEEVFRMLGALVGAGDQVTTPARRSAVFERAIWHYTTVLRAREPASAWFNKGRPFRLAARSYSLDRVAISSMGCSRQCCSERGRVVTYCTPRGSARAEKGFDEAR